VCAQIEIYEYGTPACACVCVCARAFMICVCARSSYNALQARMCEERIEPAISDTLLRGISVPGLYSRCSRRNTVFIERAAHEIILI